MSGNGQNQEWPLPTGRSHSGTYHTCLSFAERLNKTGLPGNPAAPQIINRRRDSAQMRHQLVLNPAQVIAKTPVSLVFTTGTTQTQTSLLVKLVHVIYAGNGVDMIALAQWPAYKRATAHYNTMLRVRSELHTCTTQLQTIHSLYHNLFIYSTYNNPFLTLKTYRRTTHPLQ